MFTQRVAVIATILFIAARAHAETVVLLTSSNRLLTLDHATPETIANEVAVSGLDPGETLLGIDFRPKSGALYGLGSGSHVYVIDRSSGAATRVGSPGAFTLNFRLGSESSFGFDFDPVADVIRVITNTGQNFRLDPANGTLLGTDTNPTYSPDDRAYQPGAPFADVDAVAYSNSFGGAQTSVLYAIDVRLGSLLTIDPPEGTNAVRTIGYLGFAGMKSSGLVGRAGFDISAATGTAYAALSTGAPHRLCTVNLATGRATVLGKRIGPESRGAEVIIALAVPPPTRLQNIATRGRVAPGADALIGGFISRGAAGARIVIRALGPSLAASGVATGVLENPVLTVHDGSGAVIASNDDWRSAQESEIRDAGLAPVEDRESALLLNLAPGNYTAIVSGKENGSGVGLVEIYQIP